MKRCIAMSLLCLAAALLLPLLAARTVGRAARPAAASVPAPSAFPALSLSPSAPPPQGDAAVVFTVKDGHETREVTLAEYLPGVLAAEMPASFAPEALRAQAVAARTYLLCHLKEGCLSHPEAAVCTDPGCCQAWSGEETLRARWGADYEKWSQRLADAVADTDGVYLSFQGEPILACFHSSSAGSTESSAAVWSGARPYLVSVSSPESAETVPDYVTVEDVSAAAFRDTLQKLSPALSLSGAPAEWVSLCALDESGRVSSLTVGGQRFSGGALRDAFALRSTAFTLEWTSACFRFTVTGYGHGVGMSQYGANVMALRGSTWQEILAHYYPGSETALWPN